MEHAIKLSTNLAINGKNRKMLKDSLGLFNFLSKSANKFTELEKEYNMIINNLSFMVSEDNDEQDDIDEKLFSEFMAGPIKGKISHVIKLIKFSKRFP